MDRKLTTIAALALAVASFFAAAVSTALAQTNGVPINVRPLKDLSARLKNEIQTGRLDPASPFTIEVQGVLSDQGRLDGKLFKISRSEGNKAAVAAAKDMIEAIGDAGWFQYVKQPGATSFTMTVEQNTTDLAVRVVMPFESGNRARSIDSAVNLLFQASRAKLQSSAGDEKDNSIAWALEGAVTSQDGNNVTVAIQRPAERFRAILLQSLGI